MSYERVTFLGLGLIASSMFWAMRRAGMRAHVTGYARSEQTRATAREIGLCDTVCDDLASAVRRRIWWCFACRWGRWAL